MKSALENSLQCHLRIDLKSWLIMHYHGVRATWASHECHPVSWVNFYYFIFTYEIKMLDVGKIICSNSCIKYVILSPCVWENLLKVCRESFWNTPTDSEVVVTNTIRLSIWEFRNFYYAASYLIKNNVLYCIVENGIKQGVNWLMWSWFNVEWLSSLLGNTTHASALTVGSFHVVVVKKTKFQDTAMTPHSTLR